MEHPVASKRILISGAGLSGLSFALALTKLLPPSVSPPSITILERDIPSSAAARQGYTLSLAGDNPDSGLVALRDLGLLDQNLTSQHVLGLDGAGCFKIWGADWQEMMSVRAKPVQGIPAGTVRVKRSELRRVLVDAVMDRGVEIRWGVVCAGANTKKRGGGEGGRGSKVEVKVRSAESGVESVEECDLLVVADGANSKIRAELRPEDGLEYAGAIQLVGVGTFPEGVSSPVDKNWGMQLSGGQGLCCFYAPTDEHNLLWALSFLDGDMRMKQSYESQEAMQQILDEARKKGEVFGPRFRQIVDATIDPSTVLCLPAQDRKPFHQDLDTGVVYLGDSNHAVSPFAGYGANLALKDGWDLAKSLVETSSIEDAVRRFDAASFPRAVKTWTTSRGRIRDLHSTGVQFWLFKVFISFVGFLLRILGRS
ncbi:hypothetical protein QBC34DRAFT_417303 [Podospora aff. communis PSN243]|uniref:FAD-binding domain-containing protein n=1 Tax=Podospora aff. communis PSN243 TaxID=3040156 RepID=A0AAV9G691_9PEZI|nr:hypothetical protein QBC34DRAFT_417303 [Podospora aff. communis PSN243]